MKLNNTKSNSLKSKTLGLALAAVLIPATLASATDRNHPSSGRNNVSGQVEVVRQTPGGVVTVGVDWGKRRSDPDPVVIVQEAPRREVIVVEKVVERHHGSGHHKHHEKHYKKHHGRGHGYGHHKQDREVTLIREVPRREQVTIIKTVPACEKVVVVEERLQHDHGRDHRNGNSNYYSDGKQVSYSRNDDDEQYNYYKDANQVSESRVDGSGSYNYYEDGNQVSIQENRGGQQRQVYVRK